MKYIGIIVVAAALMWAGLKISHGQVSDTLFDMEGIVTDAPGLNIGIPGIGAPQPAAAKNDVFRDFADFLSAQRFASGVAISPLDVKDLQVELVAYWKGPSIGQKGLSLVPGLHKPDAKPYLDLDVGGGVSANEQRVLFIVNMHVLNISEWVLRRLPGKSRIRMPKLTDKLAFGPMFRLPLPGEDLPWTWRNGFKLIASYGFGGDEKK